MSKFDTADINELLVVDEAEVISLLGLTYLTTLSPHQLLEVGREGLLYQGAPLSLGDNVPPPLRHNGFIRAARRFFGEWGAQIKSAVCHDEKLHAEERNHATRDAYILVGSVTATIAAHVPELVAYAALLNYVGIIVVRTGLKAFCNTDFDKLLSD